ncbi:MAG: MFS transporter, partial [Chloroflexota bacterium]|nr:MFS transporter [Chloroflexota bacterium]
MKHRNFISPFVFFFLRFASAASFRPYLVLFYQSLSFTGAQIGLLTGIIPLITLVSLPVLTWFADLTKKHKLLLALSLLIAVLGLFVFPYLSSFTLIFIVVALLNIFLAPIGPLSDSATMFMLGDRNELYGHIRLGGTIGFSIASAVVGSLVQNYGLKIAFWSAAVLFFITFLVSQKLVHPSEESETPADMRQAIVLLKNPHLLIFLLISFAGGLSNALVNTYLFPYMKALGARESIMGLALTIGTIAELPILFFVSHFIRKYKAYTLVIFSTAVTCLRFLMLAITTNPVVVLIIQLLNGFTFPLLSVVGVTYADKQAPEGFHATAQVLFNVASIGIGSAVGGFVGGLLFGSVGARGMYLVFFIFITLVLIFVSLVH